MGLKKNRLLFDQEVAEKTDLWKIKRKYMT